ncbi:hypothetical protein GCM10027290_52020 [Micromonospora sonneratiae]|uniref:Secreted protein n=1 Tax=Micromonospora sonneratiae TaxID=1184706 RepID=A0ABW3YB31_9ACTN
MAPLALARPLWAAVRRSMQVLTGLAMATLLLALGVSGGAAEAGRSSALSMMPPASAVAAVEVVDVVLVSHAGAALDHSDLDLADDQLHGGDRFPAVSVASADTAGQRPTTSTWEPDQGIFTRSIGQRAPPRE